MVVTHCLRTLNLSLLKLYYLFSLHTNTQEEAVYYIVTAINKKKFIENLKF